MKDAQVTRLGCKRDARKAVRGELEFVGSGAYRTVFADRDRRVVYKVDSAVIENGYAGDNSYANADELRTWISTCHTPAGKYLAPVTEWRVEANLFRSDWHDLQHAGDTCGVDGCDQRDVPSMWNHAGHYYRVAAKGTVSVLAMPYLPTSGRELFAKDRDAYVTNERLMSDVAHDIGIRDLHDMNWRLDTLGNPYITDYAL